MQMQKQRNPDAAACFNELRLSPEPEDCRTNKTRLTLGRFCALSSFSCAYLPSSIVIVTVIASVHSWVFRIKFGTVITSIEHPFDIKATMESWCRDWTDWREITWRVCVLVCMSLSAREFSESSSWRAIWSRISELSRRNSRRRFSRWRCFASRAAPSACWLASSERTAAASARAVVTADGPDSRSSWNHETAIRHQLVEVIPFYPLLEVSSIYTIYRWTSNRHDNSEQPQQCWHYLNHEIVFILTKMS